MRVLVVHHPGAGEGDVSAGDILAAIRRAGFMPIYCSTKDESYPDALREPADLVVAAGGDGTVAGVIKQLPAKGGRLAILPLGGSNNIARTLGIGGRLDELVDGWSQAKLVPLDVGTAYGPWGEWRFVEGVGIGMLPLVAEVVPDDGLSRAEKVDRGRETLRRLIIENAPIRHRIFLDGEELPEESLLVEALNISHAGPALPLGAHAEFGDGLLDVVCVEPGHREEMLAWLDRQEKAWPPSVMLRRGRRLQIEWDGAPLHIDDRIPERPDRPSAVTAELQHKVEVLVPAGAGAA